MGIGCSCVSTPAARRWPPGMTFEQAVDCGFGNGPTGSFLQLALDRDSEAGITAAFGELSKKQFLALVAEQPVVRAAPGRDIQNTKALAKEAVVKLMHC